MAKSRLTLVKGDITQLAVDAIVNAANNALAAGSGVCGAIHRVAGPELAQACAAAGPCATGSAEITPGFKLAAKHVIHAVGPIWHGGTQGEAQLLASAYRASLQLAEQYNIHRIAFPAISCGVYGYPLEEAAAIAVTTTRQFLEQNSVIDEVIFVCFDDNIYQVFHKAIEMVHD